jgi:alkaline phosphatase D
MARRAPAPNRREFIRTLAAGTVAVGGTALTACGGSDDDTTVAFLHGVASGDPQSDRVILWTRATPSRDEALQLRWQVATDAAFTSVVAQGTTSTGAERDYTVKVDAAGLQPGTRYFYRFSFGAGSHSPVGRTRTLPGGAVQQVKLAVFSCANYPRGYFNAYADAATLADVDAAVHLGDYLYEYPKDGYASGNAAALGRVSVPQTETLALADYRRRHAQYKTDTDLQALHAAVPMIAVWDDHEIANDTWRNGAENHTEASEGSFAARKAAALQAYHEWMPTRLPDAAQPDRIYRSFDFGSLVSLHMLDTRLVGRDLQLDIAGYVTANGFDAARFTADVTAADRQLLGTAQTAWLQARLQASTATWQVLGQQVLMGRMLIPAPIALQQVSVAQYADIATRAQTNPGSLTPQEQAILAQPSIPYNLDAWDGYAAARETVLGAARTLDKNLVVLAGDTHNAWASDLQDAQGNQVGVEFATPGVTSPGLEEVLAGQDPAQLAAGLTQLIGPLQYCDAHRRGYMVVTATASDVRAEWRYVSTIDSRSFTVASDPVLKVRPGAGQRRIEAA